MHEHACSLSRNVKTRFPNNNDERGAFFCETPARARVRRASGGTAWDEHVFVGNTSRLIREKSDASRIDQLMIKVMSEAESFRLLAEFGVDYGQGYHLGRPDITLPSQTIVEHADANIGCRF